VGDYVGVRKPELFLSRSRGMTMNVRALKQLKSLFMSTDSRMVT
jgi:hypothetical protein